MARPARGYRLADGTRVPGVTTIIGNVRLGSIEGLLVWANRLGQDGQSHREVRDAAADAGTCAHAQVEALIRGHPFEADRYKPETLEAAKPAVEAFQEWAQQTNLRPEKTELSLVSERYRYGGTLDSMLVNNRRALGDWKTSSGVHIEYLLQLAAYGRLWEESHPHLPIDGGYHLIRFSKQAHPEDPVTFEHRWWSNLEVAWKAFERCRELYDLTKRLKGMI